MPGSAIYPSLKDKIIFITGGASGIGASIVRAFDRQGAVVGIIDIDSASANQLITDLHGPHQFVQCDLRNIDELTSAISNLEREIGKAQVLVNNAARDDRHDWREIDANYWNERMDINLRHMFFAIQQIAPWMIDERCGQTSEPVAPRIGGAGEPGSGYARPLLSPYPTAHRPHHPPSRPPCQSPGASRKAKP